MGILNIISRKKESIAKDLDMDFAKRIKIWNAYLESYKAKETLAKELFNTKNLLQLVQGIEVLIPAELVELEEEEKNEKRILKDLKIITSPKWNNRNMLVSNRIIDNKDINSLYEILERIAALLKAELQAIQMIKKNPEQSDDYVSFLRQMIVTEEFNTNKLFRFVLNRDKFKETQELLHDILGGETINDKEHTPEKNLEKEHQEIMKKLLEIAHEAKEGTENSRVENLVNNSKMLHDVIWDIYFRYSDYRIKKLMKSFREAYKKGKIK